MLRICFTLIQLLILFVADSNPGHHHWYRSRVLGMRFFFATSWLSMPGPACYQSEYSIYYRCAIIGRCKRWFKKSSSFINILFIPKFQETNLILKTTILFLQYFHKHYQYKKFQNKQCKYKKCEYKEYQYKICNCKENNWSVCGYHLL